MLEWLTKQEYTAFVPKILLGSIVVVVLLNYLMKAPYVIKNSAYEVFRYLNTRYVIHQLADNYNNITDDVILFYEPSEKEMVPVVMGVAEEFFTHVNNIFDLQPRGRVPIVIHSDKESLNRSFGWDANESAMGVYWAGIIRVLSPQAWIDEEDPAVISEAYRYGGPVVHEYIHYIVDLKTKGNYTRWFTEALAQYWERELTGFQFDMKEGSLDQGLYPFAAMDRQFDSLPNQALAYSQSLAAADYIYQKHSHQQVHLLLDSLGAGLSMSKAMEKAFGYDMATFEENFTKWVKENYLLSAPTNNGLNNFKSKYNVIAG
ncbi:MAG: hypothetical protein SCK28_02525 [Bacillota bacterium]|nr:hypothetical protein [Bacillota bacterium]